MPTTLTGIIIDAHHPATQGHFWTTATNWPITQTPDWGVILQATPNTGPIIVMGPPVAPHPNRNRLRLEITHQPHDNPQTEINQLITAGATPTNNKNEFTDPEGNEFHLTQPNKTTNTGEWHHPMTQPAPITRRSARTLLIDNNAQLVLIKRTKPGQQPYWTTAGGGIEPHDPTREAAAARELGEELGAIAHIGPQVFLVSTPRHDGINVQHYYLSRLIGFDETLRTGPELTDPTKGTYELDRIPINHLNNIDLRPTELRQFIIANTDALLADLPNTNHS